MSDYRFPTRIERIEKLRSPGIRFEITEPEVERGEIGSRLVASFTEWMVALALWYLKLRFVYKKNIPRTKFQIDFYIEAAPVWMMLDVRTMTANLDTSAMRFRQRVIEEVMQRPLHTLWDYQVTTYEEAIQELRRLLN